MGKLSRTKGHNFERECAIDLRPLFPDARRHLEYQDGEAFGVDLQNTGAFRFQCKRKKKYVPVGTIFEISIADSGCEIPVLVTKADGLPAMAVLPWANFLQLLHDSNPRQS